MPECDADSRSAQAIEFLGRLRHGFPMDEIARMLMTGRPILWAWLDGTAAPAPADVNRALGIRNLMSEHFGDDVTTPYRVWRSQSRSGASLGSLFSASFIDRAAVAAQMELLASSIANLQASQIRREASRHAGTCRNGAIDDAPSATFRRD